MEKTSITDFPTQHGTGKAISKVFDQVSKYLDAKFGAILPRKVKLAITKEISEMSKHPLFNNSSFRKAVNDKALHYVRKVALTDPFKIIFKGSDYSWYIFYEIWTPLLKISPQIKSIPDHEKIPVINEAFLKVKKACDKSCKTAKDFKDDYIYVALGSVVNSYHRKNNPIRNNEKEIDNDELLDHLSTGRVNQSLPQDIYFELLQYIRWIEELPDGCREELKLILNHTYDETAAKLGIEIGNVKFRVNKARNLLKSRFRKEVI